MLNVVGFSGVAAIVVGIRMHSPRARIAWWLFGVGQLLFFSGDVYTYSNPDAPFPSPGDALYLAVYPVLMAGLLVLVRRRNPRRDPAALIDALILTIGIGLLSWVFLIAPNIHLGDISWLAKAVSIAYPLGDVLLLAAAIRLAVDAGKRAPAFYLLAGSIVCLLATDSAYNLAILKGTYDHSQLIYDLGWMAYYILWGAAALHPSMRVLEEPAVDSRPRLTSLRLALLGAACLIAPSIRFAQSLGNADVLVLIVASAVLFLLVVARMAGLVRQEERIVARERTLRVAGAELVGAAGYDQIYEAAIAGVRQLLGQDPCVHLALLQAHRPGRRRVVPGLRLAADRAHLRLAAGPRLRGAHPVLRASPRDSQRAAPRGRAHRPARAARDPLRGPRPAGRQLERRGLGGGRELVRGARPPGLAGGRGRVARGRPAPPPERGALPLARRPLERPDHGARRRAASSPTRARRSSACSGTASTRSRGRSSTGS